ncbi:MAG TPA: hypothetical protein VM285_11160 [Polyangia bacterium]|nr:hypothetical protein [Polyangia bacterium]
MRRIPWLATLAALGLVTLVAAPAAATMLLRFDVEQMSDIAAVVAVGSIDGVEARWNDTRTKIYTRVSFRPTEVLKGARDLGPLTIKMIGGQVGEDVAYLPGTPGFEPGERVLLFLEPRDDGDGYLIVGLFQGLFRLRRGDRGDELLYQDPPPRGVSLIDDGSSPAVSTMLTLADVRAIVNGGGQ